MIASSAVFSDQGRNCEIIQEIKVGYCLVKITEKDLTKRVTDIEKNDFF